MSVAAVIFDFDGTLFRLATDWQGLRDELADVDVARAAGVPVAIVEHRERREPPLGAEHYVARLADIIDLL